VQSDEVVPPSLVEKMIKDLTDGGSFRSNLENFTDTVGLQPINVPSDDPTLFVAKYDLAQIPISIPLFHKL
jgi:hypothetical protein